MIIFLESLNQRSDFILVMIHWMSGTGKLLSTPEEIIKSLDLCH